MGETLVYKEITNILTMPGTIRTTEKRKIWGKSTSGNQFGKGLVTGVLVLMYQLVFDTNSSCTLLNSIVMYMELS